MTDQVPFSPPDYGPPTGTAFDLEAEIDERTPWWGMGDILLGLPLILLGASVALAVCLVATPEGRAVVTGDELDIPLYALAISLLAQQLLQLGWPLFVARWKGRGPVVDWRLFFKPVDLGIGLLTAVVGLAAAGAAGAVISSLVNLVDEEAAENTQFLVDAKGSIWLYVLIFAVVVGAPVSEEVFFRGLTLRAIEKRAGQLIAIIGSSLIFTLPHYTGGGWTAETGFVAEELKGTLVLFASIFSVGLVLAVCAVRTKRLAAPIIAHMIFNAVGVAGALGAFDGWIN